MKQWKTAAAAALMTLLLSGCSAVRLTLNPQELYALPKLPERYTALNQEISAILESGAEYAAPTAGSNIQPVQMTDLDSDGKEEALAFFRRADDEKPLKICIFTAEGTGYRQSAQIEGSGSAINSIAYYDLNNDGRLELIVGWRASAELQALSVYELKPEGAEELLHTNYVKYTIADLDGDDRRELVTFRTDQEGLGVADYYDWETEKPILASSARVSMTMAELGRQGRVTIGKLSDDVPALFVTGVSESARAITDVLIREAEGLRNITLSNVTGVTQSIAVFRNLYPADMNGDGVTELPCPQRLPDWDDESAAYYRIDWMSLKSDGSAATVLTTYHDTDLEWYLQLPPEWEGQILADRTSSAEEISVTFYLLNRSGGEPMPLLRITALTGSNRDRQALRGGRFVLRRKSDVIYTGELLKGNEDWQYAATEEQVRSAFSLIAREWTASDA